MTTTTQTEQTKETPNEIMTHLDDHLDKIFSNQNLNTLPQIASALCLMKQVKK